MRVVVFGLGLLGGSLCKTLRTVDGEGHISAYDIDRGSLEDALGSSVIDEIIGSENAAFDCDVAVVALPVKKSVPVIRALLDNTNENAVVIDLGSVKTGVIDGVIDHRASSRFVPCHPMAGSERSGFAGSSADLLPGANVIITPHIRNGSVMIDRARRFWEVIGMNVSFADSRTHDMAVALTSHLPHILSSAIVCAEKEGAPGDIPMAPFRGKGFRDMTRLASGSPEVWGDICEMNAPQISGAIGIVSGILADLHRALDGSRIDMNSVRAFLEKAAELKKES